ncbi:MAG: transcriptional repressor [Rhodothermales bacterium]
MPELKESATAVVTRRTNEAKERFQRFLKENSLRQTPERFAVLEEVYSGSGHFDADELHVRLKIKGERVSRATVYNTLDLLQESDLVIRHQFGQNQAKYEPAFSYRQHDHLICTDCDEVFEFCDPRIQGIQEMVGEIFRFNIQSHSLHVYGSCERVDCPNRPAR